MRVHAAAAEGRTDSQQRAGLQDSKGPFQGLIADAVKTLSACVCVCVYTLSDYSSVTLDTHHRPLHHNRALLSLSLSVP